MSKNTFDEFAGLIEFEDEDAPEATPAVDVKILRNGAEYPVSLRRKSEGPQEGDIVCFCDPFLDIPLHLELAIRANGEIAFREWSWLPKWHGVLSGNGHLHTHAKPGSVSPTQAQLDTVSGLFSGRIKWEGLRLPTGATLQRLCPINVEKEEELLGKRLYLA